MITLLEHIINRNFRKAGYRCCLCNDKFSTIEHADEGLTGEENFTFAGIDDRLYCSDCAGCSEGKASDTCDCCYSALHTKVHELADPVLAEAVWSLVS